MLYREFIPVTLKCMDDNGSLTSSTERISFSVILKRLLMQVRQLRVLLTTAKRNELDVYGYLLYLLTVLPKWDSEPTDSQPGQIMP